jgi:hypothetical protein
MANLRRIACLAVALCLAAEARACNVPVFRFALENWRADSRRAIVFHRGPLSAADAELVKTLGRHAADGAAPANLTLQLCDLDGETDADLAALYAEEDGATLPQLVVRAENLDRQPITLWSGALTEENVASLVDSPARRELVRRLLDGDTAVWVFLDGGDQSKDDASFALVGRELKRLASVLKLPELTASPDDRISTKGPPLKLAFSLLRLGKDEEAVFRRMLLLSEEDLPGRAGEPMAFPIFGRGRTLGGLIGAGITAKNVGDSCRQVIARCGCTIKEQSPGYDLLLSAGWDTLLETGAPPKVEPRREPVLVPMPTPKRQQERPATEVDVPRSPSPWVLGGLGLAGLAVLLTGIWVFRSGWRI